MNKGFPIIIHICMVKMIFKPICLIVIMIDFLPPLDTSTTSIIMKLLFDKFASGQINGQKGVFSMLSAIIQDKGEAVGIFPMGEEKTFSTGSKGFHIHPKVPINGKKYQANIQLIEIGSKPKQKEAKK